MNNNQDNSQEINKGAAKRNKTRNIWIVACCLLALGIFICLAYFVGAKPQANVPSANSTMSASNAPSMPVTPPAAVSTPSYTPPSTPSPQPAPTPQPPAVTSSVSGTLVIKQAYQMVLTPDDMGPGWVAGNAASPPRTQAFSTSHVMYTKGSAFSPLVQNVVTVYRTADAAVNAFDAERPPATVNVTLSYPNIGDECFLNDSPPTNKVLVFRKNNVVTWITIQQDKSSDLEHYARIVEQKITY